MPSPSRRRRTRVTWWAMLPGNGNRFPARAPGSVLLFERHEGRRLTELEAPSSAFIGPEGGFSPDEVAAAERAGLAIAGLGPRILRSETVAVAVAAAILSRTGDFA